jgi:hypothetical protein
VPSKKQKAVKKEIENPKYVKYDGPHFKSDKDARAKVADWCAMPENLEWEFKGKHKVTKLEDGTKFSEF